MDVDTVLMSPAQVASPSTSAKSIIDLDSLTDLDRLAMGRSLGAPRLTPTQAAPPAATSKPFIDVDVITISDASVAPTVSVFGKPIIGVDNGRSITASLSAPFLASSRSPARTVTKAASTKPLIDLESVSCSALTRSSIASRSRAVPQGAAAPSVIDIDASPSTPVVAANGRNRRQPPHQEVWIEKMKDVWTAFAET